jgi:23S rRNA (pseudouridine1915-N3)-methyltransferase
LVKDSRNLTRVPLCYNAVVKITIIQVSKTKTTNLLSAEQEYLKRLGPYAKIETITIKAFSGEDSGLSTRQIAKKKEAEEILKAIPKDTLVIALDETGRQFTSPEFAEAIRKNRDFEGANITFVTGGSYGLDESILKKAQLKLSFGKFTYTHEMIRTLLLEQIYRAFIIIAGKTYHY